jgi:hypothetical protein
VTTSIEKSGWVASMSNINVFQSGGMLDGWNELMIQAQTNIYRDSLYGKHVVWFD